MSIKQGGKVIAGNTSGRNVGDIFYTMRTDNGLNGAVECDGATYNISDFSGSGSIGALLLAGKIPYISMAEYETITAGNNDGSCGYIGWDGGSADTFRVPCLNYVFLEAVKSSESKQANYRAAGLPDHNHTVSTYSSYYTYAGGSYGGLTNSTNRTTSNASASNPIYGRSDTVQPKSVRYRAMIQLAVATTDEALETCTGVLADVAALKYDYVVDFQAPTAENNYTWFRKYKSGWVEQGGKQSFNYTTPNQDKEFVCNLAQPFSSTNYTACINCVGGFSTTRTLGLENMYVSKFSGFVKQSTMEMLNIHWVAYGF